MQIDSKSPSFTKEFGKFISAVINIVHEPQIFKQWIKEKRAWRHNVNYADVIKIGDTIEVRKMKKGEDKFTLEFTDK